ncbi:MAG TPA: 4-hydroxy-tetrahydrodipicolinate synthase [Chitinophagales bacterium]|nr:4-hydroxy-tetrahydrodipicolinate synthase [Chitinophagales bacterium]
MASKYTAATTDRFRGTGVALVTPFLPDGGIDFAALRTLIDHVIEGGVEYVVSMGTTGESATLTEEERFSIIDATIEHVNGRIPVVGGFGGNDTNAIIRSIEKFRAHRSGKSYIDAILIASPYYNKPSQEGIYQHYLAIDKHVTVPIILYNVPGRTSSNMEAATTLRIARDAEHVIAIKEASGNFNQCMYIIKDAPEGFLVISGDDGITLPFISMGMQGVISVVANAYPRPFSDMVRLSLDNKFEGANLIHYKLLAFTDLIFKEGSPAGVKAALKHLNICDEKVRLPLWKISEGLEKKIVDEMNSIG